MGRGRHWREADEISERYGDGESLSQIAKDYVVAENTVKRVVESTGQEMRGRGGDNHKKK